MIEQRTENSWVSGSNPLLGNQLIMRKKRKLLKISTFCRLFKKKREKSFFLPDGRICFPCPIFYSDNWILFCLLFEIIFFLSLFSFFDIHPIELYAIY